MTLKSLDGWHQRCHSSGEIYSGRQPEEHLVMTKEVGFVRKPASASQLGLIKLRYLKYPKVYELMADRHIRYNECLDYIDRQEKNGQAFVIRPHKKSDVGRIEKDKDKLIALYEEGYQEAENCYEDLLAYLEK